MPCVSRCAKDWIIFATVLVNYVYKNVQSERFCTGRPMAVYCDHTLFPHSKQYAISNIEIEHKVKKVSSSASCNQDKLVKTHAQQWMVSCGHDLWLSDKFKVSVFILHPKDTDAGKYTCTVTDTGGKKVTKNIAYVTIIRSCIGQALFLPGFSRGPELVSVYIVPEPFNPWPKFYPFMKIVVESYCVLMLAIALLALIIKCAPRCLCKRIMGRFAKSSDGGSSSDSDEQREVPVAVYGGGSKVLVVVDDSYMQLDYQSPTSSLVLIDQTLKINPDPFDYDKE